MKKGKLVSVILTLSLIVIGQAAFADENRNFDSIGKIEFIPNTTDPIVVEPPVTDPEVDIDPIIPGSTGPLTITYAPTLDFGIQEISNQDRSYKLIAETHPKNNNDDVMVPYISFAQVSDTRGSNDGWDLRVTLSDFVNTKASDNNRVLKATNIEFVDPKLQYNGNEPKNAPEVHEPKLKLEAGGAAQSILSAKQGTGAGTSAVLWGDQSKINAQFEDEKVQIVENDGIQLNVPGATVKDRGTYEATLSWQLLDVPGTTGESI